MKKSMVLFLGAMAAATMALHAQQAERHIWSQPIQFSAPEREQAADPAKATLPDNSAGTPEAPAATAPRAVPEAEPEHGQTDLRFDVGVRCLGVWLTDDRKGEPHHGSFVGSIYKLKAKQNFAPIHPYVQVTFGLDDGWRIGCGATFSHVAIETLDNGSGDGDIEANAFMGYLLAGRDAGRFRPYAEAGGGISVNSFDADPSWSAHGTRKFDLENSMVLFAGVGCSVVLIGQLSLDAHLRYLHNDIDGTYIYKRDNRGGEDFTFTTSYVAAGLGLQYSF